jgi:Mg-chelatase subunit ChlD
LAAAVRLGRDGLRALGGCGIGYRPFRFYAIAQSESAEPLQSVKNAASEFVGELRKGDSLGVVSFATDASIDSALQTDFSKAQSIIGNISIKKDGTQFTNIFSALLKSAELFSQLGSTNSQKVLALLTDGVATKPSNPRGKTEAEDILYAEAEALKEADNLKTQGVTIYTIGLGKDIHADFLRKLASTPENFLEAPSTTTLSSVYQQVSSFICKELPSKIEIRYKILN